MNSSRHFMFNSVLLNTKCVSFIFCEHLCQFRTLYASFRTPLASNCKRLSEDQLVIFHFWISCINHFVEYLRIYTCTERF